MQLEVLPLLELTTVSFNFGGSEFSGRPAPSLIYGDKVVASGLIIMPATTVCVAGKCIVPFDNRQEKIILLPKGSGWENPDGSYGRKVVCGIKVLKPFSTVSFA